MSIPVRRSGLNSAVPDDVLSTPEGDNEYAPMEPVGPVEGLQVPNGSAPLPYDSDNPAGGFKDESLKEGGIKAEVEKTVDRLSIGQILT